METKDLPTGTVTFLFTDIEGSTRLVQSLGDDFLPVLELHNEVLREAITGNGGVGIRIEGDSFFAVFESAVMAVAAASEGQLGLREAAWPSGVDLKVRMGLHTGVGTPGGADYVGIDVHRAARISSAAHGGQTLVSEPTALLVEKNLSQGGELVDLGKHRLKDLSDPETLFQIDLPGLDGVFPPLKTLSAVPNNLPLQVTSFVGREQVLEDALSLLGGTRVLTLTGPGGTGKTRLSLQVAAEASEDFTDGVFFADLSPVSDPSLVPSTVLLSLGLSASSPDRAPADRLVEQLADRRVLIVLDNFEHLLDAAPVVNDMVRGSPDSKFVVSSRAPLRIGGEQEMPVPPLDISVPDAPTDVGELAGIEAIDLFVERATAVRPDFRLSSDNAPAVVELVTRLDGLPLAIELVATRVKLLDPQTILERLESLSLDTGARDMPERQRTLWGAIQWSYDLLDDHSRDLFDRFAVFAGGARLEEIEQVCAPDSGADLIEALASLMDHSLVMRVDGRDTRFRMLHVIREFAAQRLAETGRSDEIARRHAHVYLEFAEQSRPELTGVDRRQWLDRVGRDHDNIRGGLKWAMEHSETDVAMRLAWAAWRFWQARGFLHEARQLIAETLGLPGGEQLHRGKAMEAMGGIAWWQGEIDDATEFYTGALEVQRQVGEPAEIANALYNLGLAVGFGADTQAGLGMMDEAEEIYTELEDVGGLGDVAWGRGDILGLAVLDYPAGEAETRRSIELYRQAGNEFGVGWALYQLGETIRRQNRLDEAGSIFRQGLELFASHDDVTGVVFFLASLAAVAQDSGQRLESVRLSGAANGLRLKSGADLIQSDINVVKGLEYDTLRTMTGDLAEAFEEGLAMDQTQAVAYALALD